jgi:hypothetical protein
VNRVVNMLGIFVIMIVGIGYSLAHPLVGLAAQIAPVQAVGGTICHADGADSFWAKFEALVELGKSARETGHAVEFKETFYEDEVNSALAGLVAGNKDRTIVIKDAKVLFDDKFAYCTASCSILGLEIKASVIPEIWLESGKPKVRVNSLEIQGVPFFLNGFVIGIVNQRIDAEYNRILQKYDYFEISNIDFEHRQVTISGVAR